VEGMRGAAEACEARQDECALKWWLKGGGFDGLRDWSGYFSRRILRFPEPRFGVVVLERDLADLVRLLHQQLVNLRAHAPARTRARSTSGASNRASTTFTPLSQCSMCSPLATSREWFHSPTGRVASRDGGNMS